MEVAAGLSHPPGRRLGTDGARGGSLFGFESVGMCLFDARGG